MRSLRLTAILISILVSGTAFGVAAKFEPVGSYICTGKVDGFVIRVVNDHIVAVDTPGIEVTYYRVVSRGDDKLTAVAVFEGFKAPVDGKLSSDRVSNNQIVIRPGKRPKEILFHGPPVSRACSA